MWYTKDPNGFHRDELLHLYKIYDQREKSFRDDLFRFTNFYSAVCYAILAMTLSGFVSFYGKGMILLWLLLGPTLTFCMCLLGVRVTRRIYHRIMKELSVKIKIENILGLDGPIPVEQFLGKVETWAEDNALLPTRYTEKRAENKNSKEFIDSLARGGFYRDNLIYFGIIASFSVILSAAIVIAGLITR